MAESSGTISPARFPRDARPAWLNDPLIVQVRDLYTRKGLSTRTIADALGLSRWRVDRVLRAAGVSVAPRGAGRARPRRPAEDLDRFGDEARALYEREGLSTRKIAETLRLSRPQVDRVLRASGVTVAPRGAGRARPSRRYQDPHEFGDTLRTLYSGERLSRRQVSERLGLSEGLVRERLAEYGIESRTRGRCNREDRHCLPEDQVIEYYRESGLSAEQAGKLLGVSCGILLRAAHDHGVAVRPGASTQRHVGPIQLVDAMYADPLVRKTLARHNVPVVRTAGPIWQRFPEPILMRTQLCVELYVDCGASARQIELLTGQPASRIRRWLLQADVPLRPPGGRSPLRLRWEARHCGATRSRKLKDRRVEPRRSSRDTQR